MAGKILAGVSPDGDAPQDGIIPPDGIAPSDWIVPQWPVPARVRAYATTRAGGVSQGEHAGFNVGDAVKDDAACVATNRARLRALLPGEPCWLRQVHGTQVVRAQAQAGLLPEADASFTRQPGVVLAIQTADCLPVLLAARDGSVVAAAHAGWRGLASGVIENALQSMQVPAGEVVAWLGPCIGAAAYQVGGDVHASFTWAHPDAASAFVPDAGAPGRYRMDLCALARQRLQGMGVASVHGGGFCTWSEPQRFYSYRRDGQTGRMATVLWLQP